MATIRAGSNRQRVLWEIAGQTARTIASLVETTKLTETQVMMAVNNLRGRGLARWVHAAAGRVLRITEEGRAALDAP